MLLDTAKAKGRIHVQAIDERYRRYRSCAAADLQDALKDGWTVKASEGGLYEITRAPIAYDYQSSNTIVHVGHEYFLKGMFNANSPTWTYTAFGFGGAGSGTTAPAITQTALVTEFVTGTGRPTLTNLGGTAFANTDVITATNGDDRQVTVQWVYPDTDANHDGSSFAEVGIFTSTTFATVVMGARATFTPYTKVGGIGIAIQWTFSHA